MRLRLVQRRLMWWPTSSGWVLLGLLALTPPLLWWMKGESFLSTTSRLDADVLVVEGWISIEGIRASALEFRRGNYRYVVATGGLTGESWSNRRWSYAIEAEQQLLRSGIPRDQVILAESRERGTQRTYEMALSAWDALRSRHIEAAAINIFTRGAHARRSRLVFKKVIAGDCRVGVISWTPEDPAREGWWRSSERSEDMIKESVGYVFELLLNSGRNVTNPTATIVEIDDTSTIRRGLLRKLPIRKPGTVDQGSLHAQLSILYRPSAKRFDLVTAFPVLQPERNTS